MTIGIRDLSEIVVLPANKFDCIDSAVSKLFCVHYNICTKLPPQPHSLNCICHYSDPHQGADYDDMRTCCVCKHICIFTAVACECDKSKVTCIRHYNSMCKCPKNKKFMLSE